MSILDDARKRFKLAADSESQNRTNAVEALQFRNGDQWPNDVADGRRTQNRPCLTINLTDATVRRVINNCRENRPRIKVHPVGNGADIEIAKTEDGLVRHIEANSQAELAYDNAIEHAISGGWGYWRVSTKYADEKSFDQEIMIEPIPNPFTVYRDPASVAPDGSDMSWCIVSQMIRREDYKAQWGEIDGDGWNYLGPGDNIADWSNKEELRLAEYFVIEHTQDKVVRLSDGDILFKSELPRRMALKAAGVSIVQERPTIRKKVMWYLLTATKILMEREWAGKYIPIIPVYGRELNINGKRYLKGMVKDLIDPARMYNYWETTKTEAIALQPKAPWLLAEGQAEGHEQQWDNANTQPYSRLTWKPVAGADGQTLPPPQRVQPPIMSDGILEASKSAANNFLMVAGMPNDPGADAKGEVVSGLAIKRRQGISDQSHYDFYDNWCRSYRHTGRIIIDLIPKIYDTERMQRIIGEDGIPDMVMLNQKTAEKIKNDVTVGTYDVVVDTGPAYQTKREESAEAMLELLTTPLGQMAAQVAGDVIVRAMDWPGADTVADRLATMIPASQIDKQSDIPPKAQMMIKQLQDQLQQSEQKGMALELELKTKQGIEQGWMKTELKKTEMQVNAKIHDTETKAHTQRDVAEIHGATQLLNTNTEAAHDRAAARDMIDNATKAEK